MGNNLTCAGSGGLTLTDAPADGGLSLWRLIEAEGGYCIQSAGATNDQALAYQNGRITTDSLAPSSSFLFNFYEITDEKPD